MRLDFTVVPSYRDYDITPDGEKLLVVMSAERAQVNVVLSWPEELKERVPVP